MVGTSAAVAIIQAIAWAFYLDAIEPDFRTASGASLDHYKLLNSDGDN
jgi:hypothetical protein